MKYLIEPIGAQFSDKDLVALANRFDQQATQGYKLHSVFMASKRGCTGQGLSTYFAVYVREGD